MAFQEVCMYPCRYIYAIYAYGIYSSIEKINSNLLMKSVLLFSVYVAEYKCFSTFSHTEGIVMKFWDRREVELKQSWWHLQVSVERVGPTWAGNDP